MDRYRVQLAASRRLRLACPHRRGSVVLEAIHQVARRLPPALTPALLAWGLTRGLLIGG